MTSESGKWAGNDGGNQDKPETQQLTMDGQTANFVSIFVSGHPQTYGDKKYEEPWKKRIASEIRRNYKDVPEVTENVQLTLKFFIFKHRKVDLDNLIKPCMDAVGSVIFEPRRGAQSIWDTDDVWVYKIIAEKELVSQETDEGVEIKVEKLQPQA